MANNLLLTPGRLPGLAKGAGKLFATGNGGKKLRVNRLGTDLELETQWETVGRLIWTTGVTTVVQTDLGMYRGLRIYGFIDTAAGQGLILQTSADGGATWASTNTYGQMYNTGGTVSAGAGSAYPGMLVGAASINGFVTFAGEIDLFNVPTQSALYMFRSFMINPGVTGGITYGHNGVGNACNAVRFMMNGGGVMNTGNVLIEGIRG